MERSSFEEEVLQVLSTVELAEDVIPLLNDYHSLLIHWSQRFSLIGDDPYRQIIDSLRPLHHFVSQAPESVVDVGSGAGLPGIPLALCLQKTFFSLVEPSTKKAGFLRNAVVELGLCSRVRILDCPFEEVRETYDIVTCRAFRNFSTPREVNKLMRLVKDGGIALLYKGRYEAIQHEFSVFKGIEQLKIDIISLPGSKEREERHVVKIDQQK